LTMEKKSIYVELCDIEGFREEMPRRAIHLQMKIEAFLKKINDSDFIISENLIAHLVFDYFTDIARLKQFHDIELTNKDKIVAYTSYWLCRRKPIQCVHTRIEDKHVFINEAITTTYIADELCNLSGGKKVPDSFLRHIYYHLKYRTVDARSIELMIASFRAGACIIR